MNTLRPILMAACASALTLAPGVGMATTANPTLVTAQSQASASVLTSTQWREDLAFMADEMERRHKDLYHTVSWSTFQDAVSGLHDRIPSMQRHEIIVEMMRIAAMVGDGHTNVSPHRDAAIGFSALPVRFYLFDDGLHVTAGSTEYATLLGARVENVNGVPVDEAIARVSAITAADNPIGALAHIPLFMQMPEVLHALGLSDSPAAAAFTFSRDGRTWQASLPASGPFVIHRSSDTDLSLAPPPEGWVDAARQRPEWLQDHQAAFRMNPMADRAALYVQLNRVGPDGDETLGDFGRRIREAAEAMNARRVILDIRLNRGGNGMLLPPFVRELIRLEDEDTRLFLLTGRGTFSAAQFLTDQLDVFSEAVLVGEPTGSKPNVMGDSRRITLPNSGVTVRASIYWWQMDQDHDRPWTAPEVAAPLTFADYAAGRDPVLEAALSHMPSPPLSERVQGVASAGSGAVEAVVEDYLAAPANRYIDVERELLVGAYALFGSGLTSEAIGVLELSSRRFPTSADAHYYLASAYQALGRADDARVAVARALALSPEHAEAVQLMSALEAAR